MQLHPLNRHKENIYRNQYIVQQLKIEDTKGMERSEQPTYEHHHQVSFLIPNSMKEMGFVLFENPLDTVTSTVPCKATSDLDQQGYSIGFDHQQVLCFRSCSISPPLLFSFLC